MSGLLGNSNPSAATWTAIYTCPASTIAAARVIVTNRSGTDTAFRCALVPSGETRGDEHAVAHDKPIAGNDTGSTISFVLSAGDVVWVYATLATLSFTVTGETRNA